MKIKKGDIVMIKDFLWGMCLVEVTNNTFVGGFLGAIIDSNRYEYFYENETLRYDGYFGIGRYCQKLQLISIIERA